ISKTKTKMTTGRTRFKYSTLKSAASTANSGEPARLGRNASSARTFRTADLSINSVKEFGSDGTLRFQLMRIIEDEKITKSVERKNRLCQTRGSTQIHF